MRYTLLPPSSPRFSASATRVLHQRVNFPRLAERPWLHMRLPLAHLRALDDRVTPPTSRKK